MPFSQYLCHAKSVYYTCILQVFVCWELSHSTEENLDAVTAVTDSFKMADAFAGDWTGGAVAETSTQTVDISVRQGRVWVYRLQRMYGSGWRVVPRAKSAIVNARDAAVTARGWCSISLVKPNKDSVTTDIPAACNLWNRTLSFFGHRIRIDASVKSQMIQMDVSRDKER